ncbi:BCL2 like 11 L homeolog isoform X7 [Xenopus laevis]|uniref:BCL2 like 11 L homeolog isoform X7 n=1 Tax=Xenopus laevis TaxID=8355 RepID=A0A8J1KPV2_XENLA|nr:BCL2 like 11 L homeolog isoform X7 [Xenopus laevis]
MAKQPSVLSPECNSGEGGQLQSTSRRHSHRPRRRGAPTSLSSPFQAARNPVDQMTPELWIAQELRRIGDEFNASFTPRRHHLTSGTQVCNIISSYGKSEPYWAQVAFSTILHDPWKMTK